MHLMKSFFIAFSIYSRIPMPQFAWKEEDMKYMLCFFPWVGGVIGVCVYLWSLLCGRFGIGNLCYTLIGTAIPLLLTGGFHVDGFMDTMDAFHSWQPREKKLEILKDSHIGAFAVIMLGAYGLIYTGAFSQLQDAALLRIVCAGFFLARCLSGIAILTFPSAKKDGMLYQFASSAQKKTVKGVLYLQTAACMGFMLLQSLYAGGIAAAAAWSCFAYYGRRCKKELGGITGDTAGYFVLICEVCMLAAAAAVNVYLS